MTLLYGVIVIVPSIKEVHIIQSLFCLQLDHMRGNNTENIWVSLVASCKFDGQTVGCDGRMKIAPKTFSHQTPFR